MDAGIVIGVLLFVLFVVFVLFVRVALGGLETKKTQEKLHQEKEQRVAELTETLPLREAGLAQARAELATIKKQIEEADLLGQSTADLRLRERAKEELIASSVRLITAYRAYIDSSSGPATRQGSALICPHCQTRGFVTTRPNKAKVGVSGGKATAAVLTGGWSLLAVGLSRKQAMTSADCSHCGSTWTF